MPDINRDILFPAIRFELKVDALGDIGNYTQVQGIAGVDVPLFSGIELRAIEFTGGEIFGPVNHTTGSIGAGIAFRFAR